MGRMKNGGLRGGFERLENEKWDFNISNRLFV